MFPRYLQAIICVFQHAIVFCFYKADKLKADKLIILFATLLRMGSTLNKIFLYLYPSSHTHTQFQAVHALTANVAVNDHEIRKKLIHAR